MLRRALRSITMTVLHVTLPLRYNALLRLHSARQHEAMPLHCCALPSLALPCIAIAVPQLAQLCLCVAVRNPAMPEQNRASLCHAFALPRYTPPLHYKTVPSNAIA